MKPLFLALALGTLLAASPARADSAFNDSRFDVNVQNSDASNLLRLVAAQTGLQLQGGKDLGIVLSVNQKGVTGRELLDQLSQDHEIDYRIDGNRLIVTKRAIGVAGASGNVHHVALKFANAADAAQKLQPVVATSEKLIIDEQANSLMFIGSDASWDRVSQVLAYLDTIPAQVLIEAQIVETSNNFLRELGVSLSGASNSGNNTVTGNNPIADAANLAYHGLITGKALNLDVKLAAAEQKGTAKIVSRPKVLTLNNKRAKIESGTSINVRTLSTAIQNPVVPSGSSSTGTPGLSATTGITTLNAGLTLDITPTVIGKDLLRLVVDINNSSPDTSSSVDGIPTIQNNAANTSIIVKSGETAVIAGLVKQSKSNSTSGVPVLSSIPILGGLFRSTAETDNNNELTIFITPTIEDGHVTVTAGNP